MEREMLKFNYIITHVFVIVNFYYSAKRLAVYNSNNTNSNSYSYCSSTFFPQPSFHTLAEQLTSQRQVSLAPTQPLAYASTLGRVKYARVLKARLVFCQKLESSLFAPLQRRDELLLR